ncbi:MAG: Nif3-like dinuclear metal center hexameric protein [Chloroflexi bacterium]|nr:Nif3-like dinuclear metal center hexameric protein [Chloroflexota bacterium]
MKRDDLVLYLDGYLDVHALKDYADNGLQVEGADEVTKLAFAVDACQETIDGAIAAGAQMLVVHHGLFWGKPLLIVGPHRRRVYALLDAGCSLYAAHLPLDRHPEVGNNAQLARLLGLTVTGELGEAFGAAVGVIAEAGEGLARKQLVARLAAVLGRPPLVTFGGPEQVRRIGIISGGAAGDILAAAAAGCDTYVTGEASHAHYHAAAEYGLNVLYGGHYATETVGVQALAAHLANKFGLPWTFIDRPTGL